MILKTFTFMMTNFTFTTVSIIEFFILAPIRGMEISMYSL